LGCRKTEREERGKKGQRDGFGSHEAGLCVNYVIILICGKVEKVLQVMARKMNVLRC
jgi:hypothetical protein